MPLSFVHGSTAALLLLASSLTGCVSQDLARSASSSRSQGSTELANSGMQKNGFANPVRSTELAAEPPRETAESPNAVSTSLVSVRSMTPEPPQSPRNPIIELPAGGDLREEVAAVNGGVLLDFYADWCGPCRQQGKILHQVEDVATATGTQIIKINIDEHPEIARSLSVSSLPTLIMLKAGKVTHRQTGVANSDRLIGWMR